MTKAERKRWRYWLDQQIADCRRMRQEDIDTAMKIAWGGRQDAYEAVRLFVSRFEKFKGREEGVTP